MTGIRDGYLAVVHINAAGPGDPPTVWLDLMWAAPPGQAAATVAGSLAGALAAALLGYATSKRLRRRGRGMQRAYSMLCLATLLLLAPACLANIPTSTGSLMAFTHREGPARPCAGAASSSSAPNRWPSPRWCRS